MMALCLLYVTQWIESGKICEPGDGFKEKKFESEP